MVISTVNQVVYNGDGVTTAWPYTFRIIDATDIKLTIIDADGTETEVSADYYVDTVNNTVYYPGYAPGAEPPAEDQPPKLQSGQKLVVYRELPITQEKDLGEKWPFEVIELGLDKLTMILQQIYGWWGRSFKISEGTIATHPDFDLNVPIEAGKTFRVNDDGTGFEVADDPGAAAETAQAAAETAQNAAEVAQEAEQETKRMATEEVEMFFNPQANKLVSPDNTTTYLNECNIIKVKGKTIMIDTGHYHIPQVTQAYLEEIGVTKVDYLFITHYHGDHAGGLPYMDYLDWSDCVAYIPPLPDYGTFVADYTHYYNDTVAFLQANAKQIIYPSEGDAVNIEDVVTLKMYNCDAAAFAEVYAIQTAAGADIRYNDYSMVVVMQHRNNTVVYSGDIEQYAQQRILSHHFYQNIQLYKMHHHGLEHYGNMKYCASLDPEIVTVQQADGDEKTLLGKRVISTDLQYFIDKIILIPYEHYAKIVSTGSVLNIEQGEEMYKDKDLNFLSLSPNHNRLITGTDLNTLFEGTYTITSNADMSTMLNAPTGWTYGNARLVCMYNTESGYGPTGVTGYVIQLMIGCNSPGIMFTRTFRNTDGWTDWTQIITGRGGKVTEDIYFTNDLWLADDNSGGTLFKSGNWVRIVGGTSVVAGANRSAYINLADLNSTNRGNFEINAANATDIVALKGTPAGSLTWGNDVVPTMGVKNGHGIQMGSVSNITVAANSSITGNITFDSAFGGVPKVFVTQSGDYGQVFPCSGNITSSGFQWRLNSTRASNVTTSIDWLAIY